VQTLAGSLASDGSCGATLVGPSDLLPLGDHGGLTPTAPPAAGSAAINAAEPEFCGATTDVPVDQRGNPRPIGAGCDIGAVERAASECLAPTLLLDDGRCIDPTTAALRIGSTESTVTTSVTLLLQPPGNLVRNGDAERGDLSGWDVTVGGDGWSMTGGLIGSWSFTSSYALSWLRQVVDLRVGFDHRVVVLEHVRHRRLELLARRAGLQVDTHQVDADGGAQHQTRSAGDRVAYGGKRDAAAGNDADLAKR